MKILIIMKRFGTNKDMVSEGFGRQIKIFEQLANKHEMDFICPDYKEYLDKNIRKNGINYYVRPYSLLKHFSFVKELKTMIRRNKYEVIVGSTEPLFGILGYFYAKKFGIKYIYDLQDDYRHYDTYKIPFVAYLDRKAVKGSDVVLTVSDTLNRRVRKFRKKQTITIQNGLNTREFRKISKAQARKILKLPKGRVIVYLGEISRLKGGDILIGAFKEVRKAMPDSNLLLSGKVADNIDVNQEGVIYKQFRKRSEIIAALNAADVGVVPNRRNIFSEYCFPNKLVEYMAAGLPIVATDIGDTSAILSKSGYLCRPDDKYDMAEKLIYALKSNKKPNYRDILKNLTWGNLSKKINRIMLEMVKNG